MNDLTPIAGKVGKLIRLLSSEQPGEVVAAAHALVRTLETNNLDIHTLAKCVENGGGFEAYEAREHYNAGYRAGLRKATASRSQGGTNGAQGTNWWNRLARACLKQAHQLSEKERPFIGQMSRCTYEPSEKQAHWLRGIADKLGVKL
jgi:hypothetical protein